MILKFLIYLSFTLVSFALQADIKEVSLSIKCKADYITTIDSKNNQWLRMISDQSNSHPEELVIYLHGDYGVGGLRLHE